MERVLLEARRLTKVYQTGTPVLQGIDLTLRRGDRAAIVGPPGAGKSTLLRILAFRERPTAGDLFWQGRLVTELPPDFHDELLLLDEPEPTIMPSLVGARKTVAVATADPEVAIWCRTIYRLKNGILRPIRWDF